MKDVFLQLLTRAQLRSVDEGRTLMALLEEIAPDWLPGRWGHDEPLSRKYDPSRIDELWAEDELLWKGRGAKVEGWIAQPFARRRYGLVHLGADSQNLDVDRAVTLLERLALAFEADYGLLHLVTRRDQRGAAPGSIDYVAADKPTLLVAEHRLERWLPDLYYLQLSERLDDLRERWDEVAAVREEVKRHLGENAFWSPELGESHAYDVPALGAARSAGR